MDSVKLILSIISVPEGEAVPEELNDRFSMFDRVTSIKVDLILARIHNFISDCHPTLVTQK